MTLNGHFGTGKTLVMQVGVRRLFDMVRNSTEKHVIILTSLGCVAADGTVLSRESKYEKGYIRGMGDTYLDDVKNFLNHLFTTTTRNYMVTKHQNRH